jgi:hypothetical protein
MTIETKYNIGDKVWTYFLGQPTQVGICSLSCRAEKNGTNIFYDLKIKGLRQRLKHQPQDFLFPTKEKLIKEFNDFVGIG